MDSRRSSVWPMVAIISNDQDRSVTVTPQHLSEITLIAGDKCVTSFETKLPF
jgi:hypothetical protein